MISFCLFEGHDIQQNICDLEKNMILKAQGWGMQLKNKPFVQRF